MIRMLGKRVLIEQDPSDVMTRGGLHIPPAAMKKPFSGVIIAIGEVEGIKVGDRIIHDQSVGAKINVQGKDYLLMFEDDLQAILY